LAGTGPMGCHDRLESAAVRRSGSSWSTRTSWRRGDHSNGCCKLGLDNIRGRWSCPHQPLVQNQRRTHLEHLSRYSVASSILGASLASLLGFGACVLVGLVLRRTLDWTPTREPGLSDHLTSFCVHDNHQNRSLCRRNERTDPERPVYLLISPHVQCLRNTTLFESRARLPKVWCGHKAVTTGRRCPHRLWEWLQGIPCCGLPAGMAILSQRPSGGAFPSTCRKAICLETIVP